MARWLDEWLPVGFVDKKHASHSGPPVGRANYVHTSPCGTCLV
jgi:hypothetical protein